MRKALIGILLATATAAGMGFAAPAAAQEAELSERYQRLEARNQAREERRSQRMERQSSGGGFEQPAMRMPQHVQRERVEQHHGAVVGEDGMTERYRRLGERNQRRWERRTGQDHHGGTTTQHAETGHSGSGNEHRELHRDYRREHRDLHRSNPSRREHRDFHRDIEREHVQVHRGTHREVHRDLRNEHEQLHRSNPTRREHRAFHREANREHNRYHRQWDTGWRNNSLYDWQRYRTYNRSIFSPGVYYSPFRNYRYSRFGIGYRINPGFYSSRYWISDPWQYRLPQAYPGTRWVRYYDDVLLVDVYSGEVIDVIYNFFW